MLVLVLLLLMSDDLFYFIIVFIKRNDVIGGSNEYNSRMNFSQIKQLCSIISFLAISVAMRRLLLEDVR